MSLKPYIGLQSEYQKEYLDYFGQPCSSVKYRRLAAGVKSMPPPDCRPKEYSSEGGLLPVFHGKSVAKSDYVPQPHIPSTGHLKEEYSAKTSDDITQEQRGPSSKRQLDRPPMILLPGMQETESVSKSSFRPFPLHLAHGSPPRRREQSEPSEREPRWDLTSSYQADYCGIRTKPRRICLEEKNAGHRYTSDNTLLTTFTNNSCATKGIKNCSECLHDNSKTCIKPKNCNECLHDNPRNCSECLHGCLYSYVKPLLYRTTTGTAYRPPSVFGGPPCHPALRCPAEDALSRKCEIHSKQ